ncbi:hypothetical protein ATERTT37_002126 [Aspergillus terreus]
MCTANRPEFRVLVLGDGGVGKTTFIHQYYSNNPHYTPTISILFSDAIATRIIVFQELSSTLQPFEDYNASSLGNYIDGAILMFDVTRPETYYHIEQWYEVLAHLARRELPLVLCGNKTDLTYERRVYPHHITFHIEEVIPYFETSQTALYNQDAPIWQLAADAYSDRAWSPEHKMMCRSYVAAVEQRHEASMMEFDQYKQVLGQTLELLRLPGCRVYGASAEVRLYLDRVLQEERQVREFFPRIHRTCVRFILRPCPRTGDELLHMHVCFGRDVTSLLWGATHLRTLVNALMVLHADWEGPVEDGESVRGPLPAWSA